MLDVDSGATSLFAPTALTQGATFSPDGRVVVTNRYTHGADGLIRVITVVQSVDDRKIVWEVVLPPRSDQTHWGQCVPPKS